MPNQQNQISELIAAGAERSVFDIDVTTYRNGARGIRHLDRNCWKMTVDGYSATRETMKLTSVPKRSCPNCFTSQFTASTLAVYQYGRELLRLVVRARSYAADAAQPDVARAASAYASLTQLAEQVETVSATVEPHSYEFARRLRAEYVRLLETSSKKVAKSSKSVVQSAVIGLLRSRAERGEIPGLDQAAVATLGSPCRELRRNPRAAHANTLALQLFEEWCNAVSTGASTKSAAAKVLDAAKKQPEPEAMEQLQALPPVRPKGQQNLKQQACAAWRQARDSHAAQMAKALTAARKALLEDETMALVGVSDTRHVEDLLHSAAVAYPSVSEGPRMVLCVPSAVAQWAVAVHNRFGGEQVQSVPVESLHTMSEPAQAELVRTVAALWTPNLRGGAYRTLADATTAAVRL